ncbi:hypothetical protein C8Q76DRAFT_852980 [Earliella scabrosa]|nr:hypothetical protein C8Q76DRAFT_852980 [Earliella scabrosa]
MALEYKSLLLHLNALDIARILSLKIVSLGCSSGTQYQYGRTSQISLEEIRSIEDILIDTLSILRAEVNRTKPINKLPPEILGHVFSFVPEAHDPDLRNGLSHTYGPFAVSPISHLHPLMSVCHYWRNVATGSPYLWSTIEVDRNGRLFKSPYISQHYPLHVYISGRALFTGQFGMGFLNEEGHRIRELRLHDIDDQAQLSYLASFRADDLRSCKLSVLRPDEEASTRAIPLFDGHAPRLKTLFLQGLYYIPSTKFPSLTHLIMVSGSARVRPSYSFRDLLVFLAGCRMLQALHMHYFDTIDFYGTLTMSRGNNMVRLPRLRMFSLCETLPRTQTSRLLTSNTGPMFRSAFLSNIELPDRCLVRLYPILPHQFTPTLRMLRTHIEPYPRMRISMVEEHYLPAAGGNNGVVSTYFSLQLVHPAPHGGGIRIDFPSDPLWRVAEHLCSTIDELPTFSDVRELWIALGTTRMLDAPSCLLPKLPQLTTLLVDLNPRDPEGGAASWSCLTSLEIDYWNAVACPNLHTLVVCLAPKIEGQVTYLFSLLLSRSEGGHPIRCLVIAFQAQPTAEVFAHALGLEELVEDFLLLDPGTRLPDDLRWACKVPFECRDSSETHLYWPRWS